MTIINRPSAIQITLLDRKTKKSRTFTIYGMSMTEVQAVLVSEFKYRNKGRMT